MKPTPFGLAFYGSKTLRMWKRCETIKVRTENILIRFFGGKKLNNNIIKKINVINYFEKKLYPVAAFSFTESSF